MKKSLMSVVLTVLLLISSSLFAFAGGTGTSSDPYQITTAAHLDEVRSFISQGKYFKLMNDVDLTTNWNPIATFYNSFFDGNSKKITGLKINLTTTDNVGLFGVIGIDSWVKNLGVETAVADSVYGQHNTGILAGRNHGSITGCYTKGRVRGVDYVGGLTGRNMAGNISQSFSSATAATTGGGSIGGLAGSNEANITLCYATGRVKGNVNSSGLIGANLNGTVSDCYSTGLVSGSSTGGLLLLYGGTVSNCYWDTQSSGQATSGGGAGVKGKTTADMKYQFTYAGWDFIGETANGTNDYWGLNPANNSGYPFLSWQGYTHIPPIFAGGFGTEADPYQITTAVQLNSVRNYLAANTYFKLMNDLDLTAYLSSGGAGYTAWGVAGWLPIGDLSTQFQGVFDGNGHIISGLKIDRQTTEYIGLFGSIQNAQIKNLGVEIAAGNSVKGAGNTGGLAGGTNFSTISNCYVTGAVSAVSIAGGLVGSNDNSSTVINSYATGAVSGTQYVGGLIGSNLNGSIISFSYAAGAVSGSSTLGGLVGYNYDGTVTACYWDKQTSGQSISAGSDPSFGKTTFEMRMLSTYTGWDFMDETANGTNDYWGLNPVNNSGYPFLSWQGYDHDPAAFAGGTGTETDPFQIVTAKQLNNVRYFSGSNFYFKLMNDLDLTDYLSTGGAGYNSGSFWQPIGDLSALFQGVFDGNGHKITGLKINRPATDDIGFFGWIGNFAQIKKLGVEIAIDGSVNGRYHVGGLVGFNDTGTVTGCYSTGAVLGSQYAGGLVGWCRGVITNCYSTGAVSGTGLLGGLAGYNNLNGSINYCYSTGTVSGTNNLGGLVGLNENNGTINNSYWDKETSGQTTSAGGTGKTTAEMKLQSTYTGWDFSTPVWGWGISQTDNNGYPYLAWQIVIPDAPQNLISGISGGNITLSWDAVPEATAYKIYSSDDPYGTFVDVTGTGSLSGETWTYTYTGTKKFFYVIAVK